MIDSLPMIDSPPAAVLSDEHLGWIEQLAAAQAPPVSSTTMLGRLLEDAIGRQRESTRRRLQQLEVYDASGYSEHHPDYPNLPRGLPDV